ncbi:LytR C-terminal domain-containing protein [Microbacterium sp. YY-01]|uniref:LytR C-terminal domain-containing protein n=1 Tax=Microbacterium sp. YY-01 TaxID=3421634 RepID=UPI003D186845
MPAVQQDQFDTVPRDPGRRGAHRAENPGPRWLSVLLWAIFGFLLLTTIGILAAMVAMGRIAWGPTEADPVPAPDESSVVDTSYSVLVLNATESDGLAGAVRDTILSAGWQPDAVTAGSVDDKGFADTTVYYAMESDREAAVGLAELIGGAQVEQSSFYADEAGGDGLLLTVVLGADRTPGQSGTGTE